MKRVISKVIWVIHTGLFLLCVIRFRIPIFILPWLILYLIHSYRVWFKTEVVPLSEAELAQEKLEKKITGLNLEESEKEGVVRLSRDLKSHIEQLQSQDLEASRINLQARLEEVTDQSLQDVLQKKQDLLNELQSDLDSSLNAYTLLQERIGLLELQAVQSTEANIEFQDIQERLKEKHDVQRIMHKLNQLDQEGSA